MKKLFPHFPFDLTETPQSFVARLAWLHTAGATVPFLNDIGIKPEELMSNEPHAINALAEIAEVDSVAVGNNAAMRVAKRTYDLRGSHVSAEFMSRPATVFCPACLAADDATYGNPRLRRDRWVWTLSVVRTCPTHGLSLIQRSKTKWDGELHALSQRVPEIGQELINLAGKQQTRKVSSLQAYIVSRLRGERGPEWLDSQTLEQACRSTEMLGALLKFGANAKPADMTYDDWDVAGNVGYAFTSKGEDGIADALASVLADRPRSAGNGGARMTFGHFFKWMADDKNSKDHGDIKRITREFIFANFALAEGRKVLDEPLSARRLHTSSSLATEEKLDSRTLHNLLVSHRLIPAAEADNPDFAFDAEKGRVLAAKALRTVHVIKLPQALNSSRPQADQMVDDRLITPLVDDYLDGVGRKRKSLNEADIERFLEDLERCAAQVATVPVGFVPIAKAAEKSRQNSGEILHLILGGFVEGVVRLDGERGLKALHVDPDEVKAVSSSALPGMRPSDAFGLLKIPIPSGWALAKEYPNALRSIQVQGPNGRHSFQRFMPEDIEHFMREFTTTPRIANNLEIQVISVIRGLKQKRVKPAFRREEFGIELFRTSDIPELVPI